MQYRVRQKKTGQVFPKLIASEEREKYLADPIAKDLYTFEPVADAPKAATPPEAKPLKKADIPADLPPTA